MFLGSLKAYFFSENIFPTNRKRMSSSRVPQHIQRIQKEFVELIKSPLDYASAGPISEADMTKWSATLSGPEDSPYQGGVFKLSIVFPREYPYKPPKCRFVTKIFHSNISGSGQICLDILKDQWSPVLTIPKVLLSILSLLTDPEPTDPLSPEIAELYLRDKKEHDRQAALWTHDFAMGT